MKYQTNLQRIMENMKKQGTKFSDEKCELCKKYMTEAQLAYSLKVFNKRRYCIVCQGTVRANERSGVGVGV